MDKLESTVETEPEGSEPESTVETEPEGSEPESAVATESKGVDVASLVELIDRNADRAEAAAIRAEAAAVECASLLAAFGSGEEEVPGGAEGFTAGFLEEAPTETEEEEPKVAEVRVKTCKACHVETTLLEAGQCPSCGNPFSS